MGAETVERELKLRLATEADWVALRSALGRPDVVHEQTNTYFDTMDGRLARGRSAMVRVREQGQQRILTAKDRSQQGPDGLRASRERETRLSASQWEAVSCGEQGLLDLDHALCRALSAEIGAPLVPLGASYNRREVYRLSDGYVAEVDRTRYPDGAVHFEVELELRRDDHTAEGARAALQQACPGVMLGPAHGGTKWARFLASLARR